MVYLGNDPNTPLPCTLISSQDSFRIDDHPVFDLGGAEWFDLSMRDLSVSGQYCTFCFSTIVFDAKSYHHWRVGYADRRM